MDAEAISLTYMDAMMHFIKIHLGLGIFAMGDALEKSGYIVGPILTAILGLACLYSEHRLLVVADKVITDLNLPERPDYATVAELCFATGPPRMQKYSITMRKIVNILTAVSYLGFCCVYLIFITVSVKEVFLVYKIDINVHYQMLIPLVPIFLCCMIRSLKNMSPVSTIANVFIFSALLITLYYITQELPPISSRKPIASLDRYPLFFGITIFAFLGIGLILPLQNEMKDPDSFVNPCGVLNVGMGVVIFLNILIGFLSYIKYGEEIKASVTHNLPAEEMLAQCVHFAAIISLVLGFTLQFYVPISIMFPTISETYGPFAHPVVTELIFRFLVLLFILVLAEAIPFLEYFIALVGATTGVSITLLIPPILDLVNQAGLHQITTCLIIKSVCLFSIGILGCVTGSYVSIKSIIEAYAKGHETL